MTQGDLLWTYDLSLSNACVRDNSEILRGAVRAGSRNASSEASKSLLSAREMYSKIVEALKEMKVSTARNRQCFWE